MPLQLPNLDDRTYEDLVTEALSLIPIYDPDWTNHNPADPGITLIELFAYLTEILIYRLNRVTNTNKYAFLKLIDPNLQLSPEQIQDEATLNQAIQKIILTLRQTNRAITNEDFENLSLLADSNVARSRCIPRRNLESGSNLANSEDKPGHVSLVIVPKYSRNNLVNIALIPQVFLADSNNFIDYTNAANPNNNTAFALNDNPNQFLYVGLSTIFVAIEFNVNIAGKNYDLKLEYFNGLKWVELATNNSGFRDTTSNWLSSGIIQFQVANNWTQTTVNSVNRYWIRIATRTTPNQVARGLQIKPKILSQVVKEYLEPKRLITTQLHIVEPQYLSVGVRLTVFVKPDIPKDQFLFDLELQFQENLDNQNNTTVYQKFQEKIPNISDNLIMYTVIVGKIWLITDSQNRKKYLVRREEDPNKKAAEIQKKPDRLNVYEDIIRFQIIDTLQNFLHPLTGGQDGKGWTFGRSVYVSEIYELLDKLPIVDYVTKTKDLDHNELDELIVEDSKRMVHKASQLVAVSLETNELVETKFDNIEINIESSAPA